MFPILSTALVGIGILLVAFTSFRAITVGGTLRQDIVWAFLAGIYAPGTFGLVLIITAKSFS